MRLQRKQRDIRPTLTSRSTSQPAPIALWSDSSSLYWSGGFSSASGMVHSNSAMTFAGSGLSLNGPVEYATSLSIVGAKPSFSKTPSKVAPYGPTMNYNLGLYAPGGEQAQSVGSNYFNETSTCSSSHGTWFVWGSLSPGLYWVPCNVVFLGVAQSMRITLVATGTISVVGAFESFSSYMDNLMFATTSNSPLALTLTGAGVSTKGYLWDPTGEVWITGAGDSLVCGAIGAGIIVTGLGLKIDGTSCPVIPPVVFSKPIYHALPTPIYVNTASLPPPPTPRGTPALLPAVSDPYEPAASAMHGVPILNSSSAQTQYGPTPSVFQPFQGTSYHSQLNSTGPGGISPPDPVIATDGETVAEAVNATLSWYPTSPGVGQSGVLNLNQLFEPLFQANTYGAWGTLGSSCSFGRNSFTDPRLFYDRNTWFLTGLLVSSCPATFDYTAVVIGVTNDLDHWALDMIDQNTPDYTKSQQGFYHCFFDQPRMGVNTSDVVVTFDVLLNQGKLPYPCWPFPSNNEQIWALAKVDLVNAADAADSGGSGTSVCNNCESAQMLCEGASCLHAFPVSGSPYIVYNDSQASGTGPYFGLMALTGTPGIFPGITLTLATDKAYGIPLTSCLSDSWPGQCATTEPPRAVNAATQAYRIPRQVDNRVLSAAYEANPYPGVIGEIWVSGNTGCDPGGSGAPLTICAYVFKIAILSFTPGGEIWAWLTQQFLVGSPGVSFMYPAVALDGCEADIPSSFDCPENLYISMTEAGNSVSNTSVSSYPSAVVATVPGDLVLHNVVIYSYPLQAFSMVTLQPGLQNDGTWYDLSARPPCGLDRWGDYLAAFPDPSRANLVWVVSEDVVTNTPVASQSTSCSSLPQWVTGWSTTIAKVSLQPTPTLSSKGLWMATAGGDVLTFGQAANVGSNAGPVKTLDEPVVGMAASPDGNGYWTVASDGGVFAYGDAVFYGSMGGKYLNKPMVGIAATPDGNGYWTVASDGGVFAYGDAVFYGSMGGKHLNKPVVGMAATQDGKGYWLVASDGGVFAYGDAAFYGSKGGQPISAPIAGMASPWLVAATGLSRKTATSMPSSVPRHHRQRQYRRSATWQASSHPALQMARTAPATTWLVRICTSM
ncbi:MAG: hypothetical protein ACYDEY_11380 [Acidimicrobiales bacterium]